MQPDTVCGIRKWSARGGAAWTPTRADQVDIRLMDHLARLQHFISVFSCRAPVKIHAFGATRKEREKIQVAALMLALEAAGMAGEHRR